MLAGAGDEIQGIKRGVLEIADAVAINKADGDNVAKAKKARKDFETALHLLAPSTSTWSPPVLTCSALEMKGIDEIWEKVVEHRKNLLESGELELRRRQQSVDWMWALVEEGLKEMVFNNAEMKSMLKKLTRQVKKGTTTPTAAAYELLDNLGE